MHDDRHTTFVYKYIKKNIKILKQIISKQQQEKKWFKNAVKRENESEGILKFY